MHHAGVGAALALPLLLLLLLGLTGFGAAQRPPRCGNNQEPCDCEEPKVLVERVNKNCVVCQCRAVPDWVAQTTFTFSGDLASAGSVNDFRDALADTLRSVSGAGPRIMFDITVQQGSIVAEVRVTSDVVMAAIAERASITVIVAGTSYTSSGLSTSTTADPLPVDSSSSSGNGLSARGTAAVTAVAALIGVAVLLVVAALQMRRVRHAAAVAHAPVPPLKRPRRRLTQADIRHYVSSVDEEQQQQQHADSPIPIYDDDAVFEDLVLAPGVRRQSSLLVTHARFARAKNAMPRQGEPAAPAVDNFNNNNNSNSNNNMGQWRHSRSVREVWLPAASPLAGLPEPAACHPFALDNSDAAGEDGSLHYQTNAEAFVASPGTEPNSPSCSDELGGIDLAMFKHTSLTHAVEPEAPPMAPGPAEPEAAETADASLEAPPVDQAPLRMPSMNLDDYFSQQSDLGISWQLAEARPVSGCSGQWVEEPDDRSNTYQATHDYRPPPHSDQLAFDAREVLIVIDKHPSGWWYCLHPATRAFGYAPNTYLRIVHPALHQPRDLTSWHPT